MAWREIANSDRPLIYEPATKMVFRNCSWILLIYRNTLKKYFARYTNMQYRVQYIYGILYGTE